MSHIAVFNNKKAFLRKFLIFIVFSAIILLSFASCGKTEEGKSAETETETLSEHVTETETSAATETYVTDDNFVTIGGVLTEYKGTDTVVTIPDYVTEIADRAFENAPNADKITEIRLGRGVMKISAKAFFGLDVLTKIDVSSNKYFDYSNGVLKPKYSMVDVCGLSYFFISEENYFNFAIFYMDEVENNTQITNIDKRGFFTFKESVFVIDFFRAYGGICRIPSAEIFGRKINFFEHGFGSSRESPMCAPTARDYMLFADGVYIFAHLFSGEIGSTWCISENGIYENYTADNNTVLVFSLSNDGTLCYEQWAAKYYHPVYIFDNLERCVGRDEFCYAYGTVKFSDDGPVFTPERTFTAGEKYDLEKEFDDCQSHNVIDENITSLDELIAQNAKKYKKYDPNVIKKKYTMLHTAETETAGGTNVAQNPSGFTVKNGKTAVFDMTGCGAVPSSFDEFVKSAVNGDETVANVTELQIGDAKISVHIGGEGICAFSVSYHGQTAYFYEPLSMYGNLNVQAFEYDGRFIFSSTSFGVGDTYILNKNGIWHGHSEFRREASQSEKVVYIYLDNDGMLKYRKFPIKYAAIFSVIDFLSVCTGRDEIICEYGSVTLDGTDPILSAEKTESAGERYDIGECFEYYKSIGGECETPEELFEKNKEKAAKK